MKKAYPYSPIGPLLFILFFITSCNGQVDANSPKDQATPSQSGTEIIGTPPPIGSYLDPVNDADLVSQYIRSIFQDSSGDYWFGPAGQSVARYNGKTLEYYSKAAFFEGNNSVGPDDYGNSVHAITEDKKGNIWFGTDHGAIKYDGTRFSSYTEENGLTNTRVSRKSILSDQAGTIWVGTQGGVFQYNPAADSIGGQCFSLFQLLPPIHVKDIMEDKDGNIWFASQNKGVFRYDARLSDGQGKAIKNITEKDGLGDNYAGGIAQDKMGNLWFTLKDGICRYDGQSFTTFTKKDGLGGTQIWGLYIEESGIIWITARGSTTRYDPSIPTTSPGAFTVFTPEDGLNCCVQSMYQDQSGRMWWGAGSGLFRFDGKRFYKVKQSGPW